MNSEMTVTPVNKRVILQKEFDPRSPTMDFDRTPITMENNGEIPETPVNEKMDLVLPLEFDPRSPTMDFDRTPIVINQSKSSRNSMTSQNVSFKSLLDCSYDSCYMNLTREDPSPIVSSLESENSTMDCDSQVTNNVLDGSIPEATMENKTEESTPEPIKLKNQNQSDSMITQISSPCLENSAFTSEVLAKKIIFSPSMATSSPKTSIVTSSPSKSSMVTSSPKKSLLAKSSPMKLSVNKSFTCHVDEDTPIEKENSPGLKVRSPRTPLASLNKQTNSPLNILRAKQWKDFQEERDKLGLHHAGENILPPFKIGPSSVPSKVPVRRRPLV